MVGQPSPVFSAFLERIESATPVLTEDADEDNSPGMWGHTQFAGGNMTCTSVLDTWASIGSSSFACRLIAAALTTCRVSRWLFKRELVAASTPVFYLSDNYLSEVCKLLWAAWKSAGGVSPFIIASGSHANSTNSPSSKARKRQLRTLRSQPPSTQIGHKTPKVHLLTLLSGRHWRFVPFYSLIYLYY